MVKTRSPQYPYIDLSDAVGRIEKVYDAEGRASMPRDVMAEHCGYPNYTGSAAKVLAALKKYGLIEKNSSGFKLSEDAVIIVALKSADPEGLRKKALHRAAHSVGLFSSLIEEFGLSASESNLTAQLQIKGFTKEGAAKAAKTYLSTMELVSPESDSYESIVVEADVEDALPMKKLTPEIKDPAQVSVAPMTSSAAAVDHQKEVFNLDDGRVIIEYPVELSVESYEDLSDYLELFLRKIKRRIAN